MVIIERALRASTRYFAEACVPARETSQVLTIVEYQRKWTESLNRGDVSGADEAFAPDCVIHITGSPVPDLDVAGFKQMVGGLFAAFPDIRFTMDDQIVSGDKVAIRWSAEGTHTGPLGGAPPTGKRVRIDGVLFDHVVNGRVAERWEQWDQPAMLRQLGFA
jgi:predicted ester cyclase